MTLLHRGFFQDVIPGNHGEVITCTIPDIMHNLAQEAAKLEISVANYNTSQLDGKLRHLSVAYDLPNYAEIPWIASCPVKSIRTFFNVWSVRLESSVLANLIPQARRLRVLSLHNIKTLPAFNKLLHLRYLDLSENYQLQAIPNSLTKLHNLQTLKLNQCSSLKELPRGLRKLVNLKYMEISVCRSLTHMPPKIGCLTSLQSLTMFVVGQRQTALFKQVRASDLNDLKAFINLKGSLTIMIREIAIDTGKVGGGRYLASMEHLTDVCMAWSDDKEKDGDHEALLKELQPHYNLRKFHLIRYPGLRFPSWDSLKNLRTPLSKLVEISLRNCTRLHHLPSMSQLLYLKTLELVDLKNLEYIENNENEFTPPASACSRLTSDEPSFFPSLEFLKLKDLPKLTGWCRSAGEQRLPISASLALPRVSDLQVYNCFALTSIPPCQTLKDLELIKFHEALRPFNFSNKKVVSDPSSSSSISILNRLLIDDVRCLNSWPVESLHQLQYMEIHNAELQGLSPVEKVFKHRLNSLLSLEIFCCSRLISLSGGGLEHLTALETLRFHSLQSLSLNIEDVMPWKSLHHNLRSLDLVDLPKLVSLPKGMMYLTTLRSLSSISCSSLDAIPDWISCLSSLQSLRLDNSGGSLKILPKAMEDLTSLKSLFISRCSASLKARCQETTGEDWHKIQHIPGISISSYL